MPTWSVHSSIAMRLLIPLTLAAVVALTGCTTPAATRNVFAELERLCEAQAGIRVYMPERWRPEGRLEKAQCPFDSKAVCLVDPVGGYYMQSQRKLISKTADSTIEEHAIRWLTLDRGRRVAEQIDFFALAPAPILSDAPSLSKGCPAAYSRRKVQVGEEGGVQ